MASWQFFLGGVQIDEPIGFDKIEFSAKRLEGHGIDQAFSTEIQFIGSTAKILKSYFDQHYINEPLTFEILSDVNINGSNYIFSGFINFAIYSEERTCDQPGWMVTVGILEDNFREKFLARQDAELDLTRELDLEGNAIPALTYDVIRMHTQQLYLVAKARNYSQQNSSIFYDGVNWTLPDFATTVPAYYQNSDFKRVFGDTFDPVQTKYSSTNATFVNNGNFAREITFNIQIEGEFSWNPISGPPVIGDSADVVLSFQRLNSSGVEVERTYPASSNILVWNGIAFFDPFTFDVIQTMTCQPGDRVLVFIQWGSGGNVEVGVWNGGPRALFLRVDKCCLNVTELNQDQFASEVNVLKVENAFRRILEQMVGDANTFVSDTFNEAGDGCYWNNAITNGLLIRNAQTINRVEGGCNDLIARPIGYNTTFKDLFEGLDGIFCLGWQFEQDQYGSWYVRVESRDYFYQKNLQIASFTKVSEFRQTASSDKLVNQVSIGYSDNWKNIALSGQWAIHTNREYFIDNKAKRDGSSAKLDIKSDIIAEGYAIEYNRRLAFLKDDSGSSDQANDNVLFIVWLNRFELTIPEIENSPYAVDDSTGPFTFAPGEASVASDYIAESNSIIGNIYNIYHTPARVACRWWKVLGMHTYGMANPRLRYQFGEYNVDYSSRVTGTDEKESCLEPFAGEYSPLEETTDIYAGLLNSAYQDYLFRPITIESTVPQRLCDYIDMVRPGNGVVKIQAGSYTFFGFIESATNRPQDPNSGNTDFILTLANIEPDGGLGAFSTGFSSGFDVF
jgi:hypothetical protein